MGSLLVRNASVLVTMDDQRSQIRQGGLLIQDNIIQRVGPTADLPPAADTVLDASGMIILPGLINTHHHMYQTLTRALTGAQDEELFGWLTRLYPVWAELTDEAVYVSALIAQSEMILTGCTTTTDHLYIYPNDCTLDAEVRAASELGVRFHPTRGSMSLGHSKGGLPPDSCVEDEAAILKDCRRVVERYHDPRPYSMVRLGLAPCSPFSVTQDLMREAAALARSFDKVMLHTHVAETMDEERFCLEKFGMRPAQLMRQLDWVGPDVWWAHAIWLNDEEIAMLAETRTGVAHCPTSNMRLGSGIARVKEMKAAGVKVGVGVDGSSSNDSNNVIGEARNALLLQRVTKGASALSVMDALELATRGSAAVIGREDLGSLAPGKAADFIGLRLDRLEFSGAAAHDPAAAVLLCNAGRVDLSVINGKQVVKDGRILPVDLEPLIARQNKLAAAMAARHPLASQAPG
jgi:cytosine/adenosine deaminase-related metal-dependent hydrolase